MATSSHTVLPFDPRSLPVWQEATRMLQQQPAVAPERMQLDALQHRFASALAWRAEPRNEVFAPPAMRDAAVLIGLQPASSPAQPPQVVLTQRGQHLNAHPGQIAFPGGKIDASDANASAAAYNAFNGRNGSAFVYNYKTGEVLVKVSAPTYDPMNVPEDLNDNEEYNGVFLDHTLSSTYTPGSIFKLVTAAAAMQIDPPLIAAIRLGPYGDFIIGNAPLRPHAAIVMGPRPHADTGAVFRIEKALNVGRQLAPDGEPLVLLRRVNRRVVIVIAAATAQPAGQADKQAGD